MKIGYVVLAFSELDNLSLLCEALLKDEESYVYVHLDQKAQVTKDYREELGSHKRLILGKSQNLSWGDWSLVEETIRGFQRLADEFSVDYFFLLSDSHVMLQTASHFRQVLSRQSPLPAMLNSVGMPIELEGRLKFHFRFANRRTYTGLKTKLFVKLESFIHSFQKPPRHLNWMWGSQWFGMSAHHFKKLQGYISSHPDVMKIFESSLIPDEHFFHSIALELNFSNLSVEHTSMNWIVGNSGPEYLSLDQCQTFMLSGSFFARKCEATVAEKWYQSRGWMA